MSQLESYFGNEHKLESERKDRLASELGLEPRQVAVWFQNRRARWRNKKLEEEYSVLKKEQESTLFEKCRLESEVSLSLSRSLFLCACACARISFCTSLLFITVYIYLVLVYLISPVWFPRKEEKSNSKSFSLSEFVKFAKLDLAQTI